MKYLSESEQDTKQIAQTIMQKLILKHPQGPLFVGLVGDLGAGKTAFVKGVSEFFSISETISSPTFVIQKIYPISSVNQHMKHHSFQKLVHMDLYRLEDETKLQTIRWEEYKNNPGNILCVEWPNQIWANAPSDMVEITMKHREDNKREIVIVDEYAS